MFRKSRMIVVLGLGLIAVSAASAAGSTANVNFFLGNKSLDEDDWADIDQQPEFGALMSFGGSDWPVHVAVDVLGSTKEKTVFELSTEFGDLSGKLTGTTTEVDLGVRKVWALGKVRPFVGGGIAIINGEVKFEVGDVSISTDDTGTGAWVDGGVFWRLGKHFNIGVEARFSRAQISLEGIDVEAGGSHLGMILGFGW